MKEADFDNVFGKKSGSVWINKVQLFTWNLKTVPCTVSCNVITEMNLSILTSYIKFIQLVVWEFLNIYIETVL